jgi:hypothetical protein
LNDFVESKEKHTTMKNSVEMLMIADAPFPPGSQLLGWIDRHPVDIGERLVYAVLRMGTGIEVAWNGHSFRSLPRDWHNHVELTALVD